MESSGERNDNKQHSSFYVQQTPAASPSVPLWEFGTVASIAAGVQFGWALQLSLDSLFSALGVPHTLTAIIWLCGPMSGLRVQPIVGYYSDCSTSKFGRRSPFIVAGTILVAISVFLVGYAADLGKTLQGIPADLSEGDPGKTRSANAMFAFFMAAGNVLGYAAGSNGNLYKEPKFEKQINEAEQNGGSARFFKEIIGALKNLKKPMWLLMLVTCLNWIAWFPFLLYNTDWMGKEVYGGAVGDELFDEGVRAGALGLMLNAIVLGVTSLAIIYLARGFKNAKMIWGIANFVLCICLAMTLWVTKAAENYRKHADHYQNPSSSVKAGALTLFAILGMPQAVTYSIPFALASIFSESSGAGQGLSLGVLNLAVVVPQMVVALVAGQIDAAFGGSNLPAFSP
ncbi:hypothetical protein RJ641_032014 [Dillenia turbinata]|uniref:Major facilitator superfamily (MFS) profile domain-containing protein n=1 Tax=Dillenia turbinata TaxID=194707 RepID=A0AAN8ZHV2_9MAGN